MATRFLQTYPGFAKHSLRALLENKIYHTELSVYTDMICMLYVHTAYICVLHTHTYIYTQHKHTLQSAKSRSF